MNKKSGLNIGLALVFILVGFSVWFFVGTVTPYTTDFNVVKSGKQYQVHGAVMKETYESKDNEGKITHSFTLKDDKGNIMPIIYSGSLPQNFAHSDSAVVTGVWNGKVFVSTQVLVKCPSKYEEKN